MKSPAPKIILPEERNPGTGDPSHRVRWVVAAFALAFLFRLAYGLCTDIWFVDQHQIYLIGLKFYCTGQWPYFGPDVAAHIQIPGALLGLAVGLPFYFLSIPEAPYLLLNLLSFAGLCLFGWYCSRLLPNFPKGFLYAWLLTAPWTLNWSTNIDNDSYVLFGSCLFFIGFLETLPAFRTGRVKPWLTNFLMGFAYFWNFQFHMSYVLFLPFLAVSFFFQAAQLGKNFIRLSLRILSFLSGCLVSFVFVLPTLFKYGVFGVFNETRMAVQFNPDNFKSFFDVFGRFFALASCEIPRFIGANTQDRLGFLMENAWLAPFAAVAALLGLAQFVLLILSLARKEHSAKNWNQARLLAVSTLLLIYVSFLFAIKSPAAHTYYLTLPVAMLYGFYAMEPWMARTTFRRAFLVLLACNILFHAGLAAHNAPIKSLYKDRSLFAQALREKNYHLLGERRPDTLY